MAQAQAVCTDILTAGEMQSVVNVSEVFAASRNISLYYSHLISTPGYNRYTTNTKAGVDICQFCEKIFVKISNTGEQHITIIRLHLGDYLRQPISFTFI